MNRIGFKIILFLVLWYEIAAEFRMGADPALLLALVLFFGWRALLGMAGEILGLSHPLTAALVVRGVAWLILFLWLVPPALPSQPFAIYGAVLLVLTLAGARCRYRFEQHPEKCGKAWLRERSELVVGVLLGVLVVAFLAHRRGGSLLPLAGYAMLLALPFSFGWTAAAPRTRGRYDAQFGDKRTYRDAGVSNDT